MAHQLSEDDIMLRLEQYRPTTPGSDWGPDERGIALASALHAEQATRVFYRASNRRARWAAVASGVAAAAAVALLVELVPSTTHQPSGGTTARPIITSPTPPAAANHDGPVQRLAAAARHTTLGSPSTGQFWYQQVRVDTGANINWVAPNGDDWNESGGAGSCTYYKYVGRPNPNHVNTAYLHSLPTDSRALYRYLRLHVTGSGSVAEAVFVAISDMLHNDEGLVQPDLRAGLIETLARVRSVTVRAHVRYGAGATATTFTYQGTQSLWFDDHSAQVVYKNGAPVYKIIDSLPPSVASRTTCPRGSN